MPIPPTKDAPVYVKVISPRGRVSFPHLDKPDESKFGGGKYKLTLLFPKDQELKDLKAAVIEAAKKKWGEKIDFKTITPPFRDGDKKASEAEADGKDMAAYKGCVFITAKTKNKPGIVGPDRKPLETGDTVYGGCYARASLTACTYEKDEEVTVEKPDGSVNKVKRKVRGVTFLLNSVQKLAEGEAFGGKGNAAGDFADDAETAPVVVDGLDDMMT